MTITLTIIAVIPLLLLCRRKIERGFVRFVRRTGVYEPDDLLIALIRISKPAGSVVLHAMLTQFIGG